MNCPEQITESEGAIPVTTAYAARESGRRSAPGWIAEESDGCSVCVLNPTPGMLRPERTPVPNSGGRAEFRITCSARVSDRARSALPRPRPHFARYIGVRVRVSEPCLRTIGVFRAGGNISPGGRPTTNRHENRAGGNGSRRKGRFLAASAVGRTATRMVRGRAAGCRMNRGHRAACGRIEGESRVPAVPGGRDARERSGWRARSNCRAAHRSVPGPAWHRMEVGGRRRIPGIRASDVVENVRPGSRMAGPVIGHGCKC